MDSQQQQDGGDDDDPGEQTEEDEEEEEDDVPAKKEAAAQQVAAAKAELQALLAAVEGVDVASEDVSAEEVAEAMSGVRRSMQSLQSLAGRR
eukprot:COSAG06_NODE_5983_length_3170_cov_1.183654_2_plen_92_part_00